MTAPRKVPCMWCDAPAVRFCDAVIGFEATGAFRDSNFKVTGLATGPRGSGLDLKHWTCDAPMCARHTKQVGHICGKPCDSIDRCPYHVEHKEHGMDRLVMFEQEAEARRREVYASIRRSRLAVHA